jgi:hypothetical protein
MKQSTDTPGREDDTTRGCFRGAPRQITFSPGRELPRSVFSTQQLELNLKNSSIILSFILQGYLTIQPSIDTSLLSYQFILLYLLLSVHLFHLFYSFQLELKNNGDKDQVNFCLTILYSAMPFLITFKHLSHLLSWRCSQRRHNPNGFSIF